MRNIWTLLLTGMMIVGAMAQESAETLRFGFFPPLGKDIIYRVDYRHEQTFGSTRKVVDWTHEVHLRVMAEEPNGQHSGTFSIEAVNGREGAAQDASYLIAKAIEGQTYTLSMLHGVLTETDWQAIKARLVDQLPQVADPKTAAAIVRALPLFEANGINAVLRPFWATGIGYIRAFNRAGTVAVVQDMDLPSWFQIAGSTLEIQGGKLEDSDDMLIVWRLAPNAEAARSHIGPELRNLVEAITDTAERAEVQALVEKALAGGVEAIEGGIFTWDPTPGFMRSVQLDTRIVAGEFRRDVKIEITRLKPD
ncbi:hypothetical protein [Mesorhizobium sp. A556]